MKYAPALVFVVMLVLSAAWAVDVDSDHRWVGPLEPFVPTERTTDPHQSRPLALVGADLDGDAVGDVVVSYAVTGGGLLTVYRGNLDARAPHGARAREHRAQGRFDDTPLLPGERCGELPVGVDLLAAGDLDGDGRDDVVAARRGDRKLWTLRGLGAGRLDAPRVTTVAGALTALIVTDLDRGDAGDDLLVGILSEERSELLRLRPRDDGTLEALRLLTGDAGFGPLAAGHIDGDKALDLAVACGARLSVFLGDGIERFEGGPSSTERFDSGIRALTIGEFDDGTDHGRGLAALLDDGDLLLWRPGARPFSLGSLPAGARSSDTLIAVNLSNRPGDDLLLADADARRLWLRVGGLPVGEWVEVDTEGAPIAVLNLSLNADPFDDLVVLSEGAGNPSAWVTAASQIHAVDSTGDDGDADTSDGVCATGSGSCTLRAAIEQANAAAGTDAIRFDIPGVGPHVIQPQSALPQITDPLLLDATTEPDYAGTPVVELDGSLAGDTDGLVLVAGSSSVRGLAVNGFAWSGVVVTGGAAVDDRIQACHVGIDNAGATARPNLGHGIYIDNGARNTVVGTDGDGVADADEGNLISGNGASGVMIIGAETEGNVVAGNRIGTDADGVLPIGNHDFGVTLLVGTHGNVIGTDGDGLGDLEERNLISGNQVRGILVAMEAEQNVIAGNLIGTDVSGASALPNAEGGVEISNGARFNRLGSDADGVSDDLERNVVSGNQFSGIILFGEPPLEGNVIAGNYVGTDATGGSALGNEYDGISISDGVDTVVGGAVTAARNVVSGNGWNGLSVSGTVATGTWIQGNYFGTDVSGSLPLGNGSAGVVIGDSPGNLVGTDGDGVDDDAERNLISGNGYTGILVYGSGAQDNVVAGNLIGTEATGTSALANANCGIELSNGPRFNRIGTDDDDTSDILERNLISGNAGCGISLFGDPGTDDNRISGNFIGTAADGMAALGNSSHGIILNADANRNLIGGLGGTPGTCEGPCNLIAYNGTGGSLDGVRIVSGTENAVVGNLIHDNFGGTGIDIDAGSTTPNDHGDADGGANNCQNFPMLNGATTVGSTTTIEGTLDSLPDTTFHLEIFANSACDFSGYGQGEVLLGTQDVTTGTDGMAGFSMDVSPPVPEGFKVSATATRLGPGGVPTDTSEFSPCLGLGAAVSAGAVPDGDMVPGTGLLLDRDGLYYVVFTWEPSCIGTDEDYAIYVGSLGDFTSHYARVCTTGGLTTRRLRLGDPFGANYFFVVPLSEAREGSHGVDSSHVERAPGDSMCHEQSIAECP